MVSKNNKIKKMEAVATRQSHFGIRKLTIGAASVLLGTTLWLGTNANVTHAEDEKTNDNGDADQAQKTETTAPQISEKTQVVVNPATNNDNGNNLKSDFSVAGVKADVTSQNDSQTPANSSSVKANISATDNKQAAVTKDVTTPSQNIKAPSVNSNKGQTSAHSVAKAQPKAETIAKNSAANQATQSALKQNQSKQNVAEASQNELSQTNQTEQKITNSSDKLDFDHLDLAANNNLNSKQDLKEQDVLTNLINAKQNNDQANAVTTSGFNPREYAKTSEDALEASLISSSKNGQNNGQAASGQVKQVVIAGENKAKTTDLDSNVDSKGVKRVASAQIDSAPQVKEATETLKANSGRAYNALKDLADKLNTKGSQSVSMAALTGNKNTLSATEIKKMLGVSLAAYPNGGGDLSKTSDGLWQYKAKDGVTFTDDSQYPFKNNATLQNTIGQDKYIFWAGSFSQASGYQLLLATDRDYNSTASSKAGQNIYWYYVDDSGAIKNHGEFNNSSGKSGFTYGPSIGNVDQLDFYKDPNNNETKQVGGGLSQAVSNPGQPKNQILVSYGSGHQQSDTSSTNVGDNFGMYTSSTTDINVVYVDENGTEIASAPKVTDYGMDREHYDVSAVDHPDITGYTRIGVMGDNGITASDHSKVSTAAWNKWSQYANTGETGILDARKQGFTYVTGSGLNLFVHHVLDNNGKERVTWYNYNNGSAPSGTTLDIDPSNSGQDRFNSGVTMTIPPANPHDTVVVFYKKNDTQTETAKIKYVDDDNNQAEITGTSEANNADQSVTGQSNATINFTDANTTVNSILGKHYVYNGTDDGTTSIGSAKDGFTNVKWPTFGTKSHEIIVHFKHATQNVNTTKTVTRTINYLEEGTNTQLADPDTETVTFAENGTHDLVDSSKDNINWTYTTSDDSTSQTGSTYTFGQTGEKASITTSDSKTYDYLYADKDDAGNGVVKAYTVDATKNPQDRTINVYYSLHQETDDYESVTLTRTIQRNIDYVENVNKYKDTDSNYKPNDSNIMPDFSSHLDNPTKTETITLIGTGYVNKKTGQLVEVNTNNNGQLIDSQGNVTSNLSDAIARNNGKDIQGKLTWQLSSQSFAGFSNPVANHYTSETGTIDSTTGKFVPASPTTAVPTENVDNVKTNIPSIVLDGTTITNPTVSQYLQYLNENSSSVTNLSSDLVEDCSNYPSRVNSQLSGMDSSLAPGGNHYIFDQYDVVFKNNNGSYNHTDRITLSVDRNDPSNGIVYMLVTSPDYTQERSWLVYNNRSDGLIFNYNPNGNNNILGVQVYESSDGKSITVKVPDDANYSLQHIFGYGASGSDTSEDTAWGDLKPTAITQKINYVYKAADGSVKEVPGIVADQVKGLTGQTFHLSGINTSDFADYKFDHAQLDNGQTFNPSDGKLSGTLSDYRKGQTYTLSYLDTRGRIVTENFYMKDDKGTMTVTGSIGNYPMQFYLPNGVGTVEQIDIPAGESVGAQDPEYSDSSFTIANPYVESTSNIQVFYTKNPHNTIIPDPTYVVYTPVEEKGSVTVNVHDDTDNVYLHDTGYDLTTGQENAGTTVNYPLSDVENDLAKRGYQIVGTLPTIPDKIVAKQNPTFTIHVTHKFRPVTPTDPVDPTHPIDPDHPTNPVNNDPTPGLTKDDLQKTVKRTINYIFADGTTAANHNITQGPQSVSFEGIAYIDETNGKLITVDPATNTVTDWNKGSITWTPTSGDMAAIDKKDVAGYDVVSSISSDDNQSVAKQDGSVSDISVSKDTPDITVTIVYAKTPAATPDKAQVEFIDEDESNKVLTTLKNDNGSKNETISFDGQDKTLQSYLNAGYVFDKAVSAGTNDQDTNDLVAVKNGDTITVTYPKFDGTPNNVQYFKIYLKHGTSTQKETDTTTAYVHYEVLGNDTDKPTAPADSAKQTINWTKSDTVDAVTNQVTKEGTWTPDKTSFSDVTSPTVNGYTPDQATVSFKAPARGQDQVATVYYTKNTPVTDTANIKVVDEDDNNAVLAHNAIQGADGTAIGFDGMSDTVKYYLNHNYNWDGVSQGDNTTKLTGISDYGHIQFGNFDKNNKNQSWTIYLKHATDTVDHNHPGNGYSADQLQKTVTTNIKYVDDSNNGAEMTGMPEIKETVTFNGSGTYDKVTGNWVKVGTDDKLTQVSGPNWSYSVSGEPDKAYVTNQTGQSVILNPIAAKTVPTGYFYSYTDGSWDSNLGVDTTNGSVPQQTVTRSTANSSIVVHFNKKPAQTLNADLKIYDKTDNNSLLNTFNEVGTNGNPISFNGSTAYLKSLIDRGYVIDSFLGDNSSNPVSTNTNNNKIYDSSNTNSIIKYNNFDNTKGGSQHFVLYLVHSTSPVDPDNPGAGYSKSDLQGTVTRTVNYVDQDGNSLGVDPVTETVTFKGQGTIDNVTGKLVTIDDSGKVTDGSINWTYTVTPGNKTGNTDSYEFTSLPQKPTIMYDGSEYDFNHVDQKAYDDQTASGKGAIKDYTVNHASQSLTINIVYSKKPAAPTTQKAEVIYRDLDNNNNVLAHDDSLTNNNLQGTAGQVIHYDPTDKINTLEGKGYVLVNNGFAKGIAFDDTVDSTTPSQIFYIDFRHGTRTVDPKHPVDSDHLVDPNHSDNPNNQHTPTGLTSSNLQKTVTRTINYESDDAAHTVLSNPDTEKVTFTGQGTIDLTTGKLVKLDANGNIVKDNTDKIEEGSLTWTYSSTNGQTGDGQNYTFAHTPEVSSLVKDGKIYNFDGTVDPNNLNNQNGSVKESTVKFGDKDINITVYYKPVVESATYFAGTKETESVTRTINYLDKMTGARIPANLIADNPTEQVATLSRTPIYDAKTKQLVGYGTVSADSKSWSKIDGAPDDGWTVDSQNWDAITSPNLSAEHYTPADKNVDQVIVDENTKDQTVDVYYGHQFKPVNPTNNPNGFDGIQLTKKVTRTITYVVPDGFTAPTAHTDEADFEGDGYVDEVTGKLANLSADGKEVKDDNGQLTWKLVKLNNVASTSGQDSADFGAITNPTVEGVHVISVTPTADGNTAEVHANNGLNHLSQDINIVVVYAKNAPAENQLADLTFYDQDKKQSDGTYKQLGKLSAGGKANSNINFTGADDVLNALTSGNYSVQDIFDDNSKSVGTNYDNAASKWKYDNVSGNTQHFIVYLAHKIDHLNPNNSYGKTGLTKTITETVHYVDNQGHTLATDATQKANYSATALLDKATGKLVEIDANGNSVRGADGNYVEADLNSTSVNDSNYFNWGKSADFNTVISPTITGYHVISVKADADGSDASDPANKNNVKEYANVAHTARDWSVTVTYAADPTYKHTATLTIYTNGQEAGTITTSGSKNSPISFAGGEAIVASYISNGYKFDHAQDVSDSKNPVALDGKKYSELNFGNYDNVDKDTSQAFAIYLTKANVEKANLQIWDISDKDASGKAAVIGNFDDSGSDNTAITFAGAQTTIDALIKSGYKVVEIDNGSTKAATTDYGSEVKNWKFDNKPGIDQNFVVQVEHTYDKINPNNSYGRTDLTKQVKEAVHYVDEATDNPVASDYTNTLTFTGQGMIDKVTGKLLVFAKDAQGNYIKDSKGDYTFAQDANGNLEEKALSDATAADFVWSNPSSFAKVTSPTITGYTLDADKTDQSNLADGGNIKEIDNVTYNHTNVEATVYYKAKPVHTQEAATLTIIDDTTGNQLADYSVTGQDGAAITFKDNQGHSANSQIASYLNHGYDWEKSSANGLTEASYNNFDYGKLDTDPNTNQTWTIYLIHKTKQLTPSDNYGNESLDKKITRTVEYQYDDGSTAANSVSQTVEFNGQGYIDQVTGQLVQDDGHGHVKKNADGSIVPGEITWKLVNQDDKAVTNGNDTATFAAISKPTVDQNASIVKITSSGDVTYSVNNDGSVDAQNLTHNDNDSNVVIVYHKGAVTEHHTAELTIYANGKQVGTATATGDKGTDISFANAGSIVQAFEDNGFTFDHAQDVNNNKQIADKGTAYDNIQFGKYLATDNSDQRFAIYLTKASVENSGLKIVDDTENRTLTNYGQSGKTGDAITFADGIVQLQNYLSNGYIWSKADKNGTNLTDLTKDNYSTYDFGKYQDNENLVWTIHLVHQIVPVDHNHPGKGYNSDQLQKTVTTKVSYVDEKGNAIPGISPVNNSVTFNGSGHYDAVTKKWTDKDGKVLTDQSKGITWTYSINGGAMQNGDTANFTKIDAQHPKGYTYAGITGNQDPKLVVHADDGSIDAQTVTPTSYDSNLVVHFAKKQGSIEVIYHDNTSDVDLTGYGQTTTKQDEGTNFTYKPNAKDLPALEKLHYVVDGQLPTIPNKYTDSDQRIVIYVKHGTQTVPVTQKVTRDFIYVFSDGTQAKDHTTTDGKPVSEADQTAIFTGHKTIDLVTDKTVSVDKNGNIIGLGGPVWNENSAELSTVATKEVKGYHVVSTLNANVDGSVGEVTVTPNSGDIHVRITYAPDDHNAETVVGKQTIHYVDGDNNNAKLLDDNVNSTFTFTKNGKTGQWNSNSHQYDDANAPVISGYVAEQKTYIGQTATPLDPNKEITIIYHKISKIIPIDKNGNKIPNQSTPTYVNDPKDPTKVIPNEPTPNIPGWHIANNPNPGKTPDGKTNNHTVTPVDPTKPTNVTYEQDGTTLKNQKTVTASQKVKYQDDKGNTLRPAKDQSFTFTYNGDTYDAFTGDLIKKGTWNVESHNFDGENVPVIAGYTLSSGFSKNGNSYTAGGFTTDPNASDKDRNRIFIVIYSKTPNKLVATTGSITYYDDTDNRSLESASFNGNAGDKINYTTADRISYYEGLGYDLVSNNFVDGKQVFDKDANKNIFAVHLKHATVPVTPQNPGKPGQEVPKDPKNPNEPDHKYPDNYQPQTLTKKVTRTVSYVFTDGKRSLPDVKKTIEFTGQGTLDLVTGHLVTVNGDHIEQNGSIKWNPSDAHFDPTKAIDMNGYYISSVKNTNSQAAVDSNTGAVSGETVTPTSNNIDIVITLTPNPVTPPIHTTQTAILTIHDATANTDLGHATVQGTDGNAINFGKTPADQINYYLAHGYEWKNATYNGKNLKANDFDHITFGTFDKNDDSKGASQAWVINLVHGYTPVNPDHPDDKDGYTKDYLDRKITRDITYINGQTGKEMDNLPAVHQSTEFKGSGYLDNVTGKWVKVKNGAIIGSVAGLTWTPDDQSFTKVDAPKPGGFYVDHINETNVNGYTVGQDGAISAQTVNKDTANSKVEIAYMPVSVPKNVQQANLTIIDDTNHSILAQYNNSGESGNAVSFNDYSPDVIENYIKQGYVVVGLTNDNNSAIDAMMNGTEPTNWNFGKYDDKNDISQNFTITLKHGTENITPNNPDPDHGYTKDSLTKTGTQIIHYIITGSDSDKPSVPADHTANVTFTHSLTIDKVTGKVIKDHGWTPVSGTYVQVDTPSINGYEADKKNIPAKTVTINPKTGKGNIDDYEVVVYTKTPAAPDKAAGTVVYIDDTAQKTLTTDDLSGQVGSRIDYTTAGKIADYEKQGYKLVSNNFRDGQEIFVKTGNNFEVHLVHTFIPINPNTKDKHGVNLDTLEKTVKETVHYVGGGNLTPKDNVQTSKWSKQVTYDEVTGKIVTNGQYDTDWSIEPGQKTAYGRVNTPVVPGYHADQDNVPATRVTQNNITKTVTYSKNPTDTGTVTITVHDNTTGQDLSQYGYSSDRDGKPQNVGTKIDYNKTQIITDLINHGYRVINPDVSIPTFVTKGNTSVTIDVEHTMTTVTSDKPGVPGQPIDPANPNGPKYPTGTNIGQLEKKGTQTIHYIGAGNQTPADNTQSFTFTRQITFDNVTGQIINTTPWSVASHTFTDVNTPVVQGYHADRKSAGGTKITPEDLNKTIVVAYTSNGKIVPVDQNGQPIPDAPQPVLPTNPTDSTKVDSGKIPEVSGYTPDNGQVGDPVAPDSQDLHQDVEVPYRQSPIPAPGPINPEPAAPGTVPAASKPTASKPTSPAQPTTAPKPSEPQKPDLPAGPKRSKHHRSPAPANHRGTKTRSTAPTPGYSYNNMPHGQNGYWSSNNPPISETASTGGSNGNNFGSSGQILPNGDRIMPNGEVISASGQVVGYVDKNGQVHYTLPQTGQKQNESLASALVGGITVSIGLIGLAGVKKRRNNNL